MELVDILVVLYLSAFLLFLVSGYPVGFVLGGLGLIFGLTGDLFNLFGAELYVTAGLLQLAVGRFFSTMTNVNLIPVPLFIFMGVMLDRSGIAAKLIKSLQLLMNRIPGGLALAVTFIGVILAATTGIIGASVVLLGTLALPQMLQSNYKAEFALGTIVASGTLGILIPPSIMLIVMADQMTLSVPDLFKAALLPSLILSSLYMLYIVLIGLFKPSYAPVTIDIKDQFDDRNMGHLIWSVAISLVPPAVLICAVLGSIFMGIATPAEAAGVGALGALLLALAQGKLSMDALRESCHTTSKMTGFVFLLLYGAPCFALTLRGLGGDEIIENILRTFIYSQDTFVLFYLAIVFLLGFFLDWIEITVILIPLILPIAMEMQIDIYWLAVLTAVCLQTSFLTPPMGPAIFYVQGVAPEGIKVEQIYRGVLPYVVIQIIALLILFMFPGLVNILN